MQTTPVEEWNAAALVFAEATRKAIMAKRDQLAALETQLAAILQMAGPDFVPYQKQVENRSEASTETASGDDAQTIAEKFAPVAQAS